MYLVFVDNTIISKYKLCILGDTIQQNFHIEIDIGHRKIGFAHTKCNNFKDCSQYCSINQNLFDWYILAFSLQQKANYIDTNSNF